MAQTSASTISSIMDGVVFVNREGEVGLINSVAKQLLGERAFNALGKPAATLFGDSESELLNALLEDLEKVPDEGSLSRTIEVHEPDEDLRYIELSTWTVSDYRGQYAGAMVGLRDITSDYKSDQLRNQYLSIVAHELRTPLTGIKTFSTMMAKGSLGELNAQQDQAIQSIREQSLRLEHQIDKLINLGKIDSNDYAQDPEVLDIAELVASAAAPFEQIAADSGVRIRVDTERAAGAIRADRTDVKRALKALVENAVKFTPADGNVTVSAVVEDGHVEFQVQDTGIGINSRYHRRIFEKFFQVEDPLTRHHGGAGLGLFVAQGILAAHRSRIEVESELGSGTSFRFALPVFEIEIANDSAGQLAGSPR